jgi:hypothetical protein
MKYLSKTMLTGLAIGVVSCALFSQEVQAVMISGSMTFKGTVNLDGPMESATAVTDWYGHTGIGRPKVLTASGDFSSFSLVGRGVEFAGPWTFNSGSVPDFWTVGGFTFDLTSSGVVTQNSNLLNASGTGFVSGNGFDSTAGTWSFTTRTSGAPEFLFSVSTGDGVPDGGATVALLGLALAGVEVVRRKLKAA